MYHYRTGGVFRQVNVYIKQRRLLIKHIIDSPPPVTARGIMNPLYGPNPLRGPLG